MIAATVVIAASSQREETDRDREIDVHAGPVPPKGDERPAVLTPNGSCQTHRRPGELRRAAGRLLVAPPPVRILLPRAKHLFVAAIDG